MGEAEVRSFLRPDGRWVVRPNGAWGPRAALAARELAAVNRATVLTTVDAEDDRAQRALTDAGFIRSRMETVVELQVDHALEALASARAPEGISVHSAADVDVDRLRALDDDLRDDIPGTSGWRNSAPEFRADTFDAPAFDPSTYLIAVDEVADEYAGLVRIWMNSELPRVGMWGVRRAYRRRGIASVLLATALAAARAKGATRATTEIDVTNRASLALAARAGAYEVGATIEFAYTP